MSAHGRLACCSMYVARSTTSTSSSNPNDDTLEGAVLIHHNHLNHCMLTPLLWATGKGWKRMITKACFVGDGFTRKPVKFERFIRPSVGGGVFVGVGVVFMERGRKGGGLCWCALMGTP